MPYAELRTRRARLVSKTRSTALLFVLMLIGACRETNTTGALPMVGPLASFSTTPIGVSVADLMSERSAITRAPLGGMREAVGEWVLHYDVPPPASEELYATTRVAGVTAMRALPDSQSAVRLRDSLIAEIGTSTDTSCVTVRRGRQRVPATIVRRGDREYVVSHWSRDLPAASANSPDSIPLPVLFALEYRPSAAVRPDEEASPCGSTAPAPAK